MDRLSCLPDDVICHILSFCPTQRSVQTSVLSKRWRFLWSHVPFLAFRGYPRESPVKSKTITEILFQHKHDIHTFILHEGDPDCSEEDFESWFVNITTRNISKLVLTLDHQFMLPQCLFTCKTLTDLLLGYCYVPMNGIYFPALKKLRLDYVQYESQEFLAHLISGCPVLEELRITGGMLGDCCISSPTLNRLVLSVYFEVTGFGLKLDTPALRYICLKIDMPDIFSAEALDSLIEAEVELYWDMRQNGKFAYSRNVLTLVGKLYNVNILKLDIEALEMIYDSEFSAMFAKFHNLTQLSVVSTLGVTTIFLENNNNLRVLDLGINAVDIGNQYCSMPKQVPACLASHLQTVIVKPFRCSEEEFDFARYILKNAKVLKRMQIFARLSRDDWKEKFEAIERLALFKRGSQECELVFG